MAKYLQALILLGALLAGAIADENVSLVRKGANGQYHIIVTDSEAQVAVEYVDAGKDSVLILIDYKTGYMAVKAFEKQACYTIKMSQDFPPLNKLMEILGNLKTQDPSSAPPQQYIPTNISVKNPAMLGDSIQAVCHNLPIYWTQRQSGMSDYGMCLGLSVDVWVFGMCLGLSV
ncbi:gastrokine-1-like isoform X3 [Brienomyrus brachyistius]|uniref:gastrokine-1-like isoform X2 n=1 Tax=Brienomyrus brachyistius TaxID=42636 RepID=UPI0020B2375B|nr:gastrokine-1-like isoform X2 [Brienomyrus brachyistius]XP_048835993.1 gastrokine-1-like isoform X3 [Brienomyrus brachyistius]